MALASSKLHKGKRPPAWPMMVRRSPVFPRVRFGMSPALACKLAVPQARAPNPAAAEVERKVLRRIVDPRAPVCARPSAAFKHPVCWEGEIDSPLQNFLLGCVASADSGFRGCTSTEEGRLSGHKLVSRHAA